MISKLNIGAIVKRSSFIDNLPSGSLIIKASGLNQDKDQVNNVEEIRTVATIPLCRELLQYAKAGHDASCQRDESKPRWKGYKAEVISGEMRHVVIYVCKGKRNGKWGKFTVDGQHRLEGILSALDEGFKGAVTITIIVLWSENEMALDEYCTKFDSRNSVRSTATIARFALGKDVVNDRLNSVLSLNTALTNLRMVCGGDASLMHTAWPKFKPNKIATYANFRFIKDHELPLLNWYSQHFPIGNNNSRIAKLLSVGVATALIHTVVYARVSGISIEKVRQIWQNYITNSGGQEYEEFWRLRTEILDEGVNGSSKCQSKFYNWAMCAFNMAYNGPQSKVEVWMPGLEFAPVTGLRDPEQLAKLATKKAKTSNK